MQFFIFYWIQFGHSVLFSKFQTVHTPMNVVPPLIFRCLLRNVMTSHLYCIYSSLKFIKPHSTPKFLPATTHQVHNVIYFTIYSEFFIVTRIYCVAHRQLFAREALLNGVCLKFMSSIFGFYFDYFISKF